MKTIVKLNRIILSSLFIILGYTLFGQSLTIDAPTGSEERKFGETLDIVWTNSDPISTDRFYYYYSVDGGSFVNIGTLLHSQLTNDGSQSTYTWTIPDLGADSTSQVRVRVWNQTRNVSDTSEAFRVYYQPEVSIISPAGSEDRKFGETLDVTWVNGDLLTSDRFYYYYSVDGGSFVNIGTLLHSQLTNDGSQSTYTWTIPDLGADSTSQVRVRVWNQTRNVSDTSEAFRVYYQPEVSIISPAGSEDRKFGETLDVTWVNGDLLTSDRFYFYYSVDGGSFSSIGTLVQSQLTVEGNESTYTWTIPDLGADSTSQVRVRVWNQTRNVSDTSEAFRVYYQPEVSIISPAGSEDRKFGETLDVTWVNGDLLTSDRFYFYYSVDGGSFSSIGTLVQSQLTVAGNESTYTWTIPDLGADSTSQVRVRVWNQTRNVSDTSEAFRVYYQPEVSIISPAGSEDRKFGETLDVTWVNGDLLTSDRFYFYYSVDGGSFSSIGTLVQSQLTVAGNESTYTWTIPDLGADSTSQVRVRVWNQTRNVSDTSEAFRVYYQPEVSIISPANGEFVPANSTLPLIWENGDLISSDRFYFYYSVDGGSFASIGTLVHSQLTNDGTQSTYNWTTPDVESTNVKIRIWNQTRNVSDTTKSFFVCNTCPGMALYAPNGGETYYVGQNVEIGWSLNETTWESSDNVVIEFSADGGVNYEAPIFDNQYGVLGGNTAPLIVPDFITEQGMIRVTNTTTGDTDTSNGTFQIVAGSLVEATDLLALENQAGSVTLVWSDNELAESGYRIQFSEDNLTWTDYSGNLAADTETFTTGALTPGTSYWWRVQVYNEITTAESLPKFAGRITPPGNALRFDGIDDKVVLADPESFNFSSADFTIETWVKFDNIGSTQVFISDFNGTPSGSMGMAVQADGSFAAFIGSNTFDLVSDPGLVEPEVWYHVALVRSGDNATLYQNGVQIATAAGMSSRVLSSVTPMSLGYQPSGSPFYFSGEMDEVRFWLLARTETEINDNLYNTVTQVESGLIAYYRFDQSGEIGILPDRSALGLDGTIETGASNAVWVLSEAMSEPMFTLQVLSPNSGEVFDSGTTQTIAWITENIEVTDLIEIQLSTDGGTNYSIIADGTFATYPEGTFEWIVPEINTNQARIRVVNTTTGLSDASDGNFTINIPVEPTISLITPEGGEFWEIGSQQLIQWVSEGFESEDFIEVNVSRDGGENYELIGEGSYGNSYPNDQMTWTVEGLASDNVFVQVANTTKGVSAATAEPLEIGTFVRSITVTSPNGGETWMQENPATITWESEGVLSSDNIQIQLSIDGGDTFPFTIVNATFGQFSSNTFTWSSVGIDVTQNAMVKITNATQGISDVSDGVFTVIPAADVTAPSFNNAPSVTIGNQDYNLSVILNEVSTVYFVALADGSNLPNASQIKAAVLSEEPLSGQVASGSFDYTEAFATQSFSGSGNFTIGSQYDFYFTAEDAEGNLNAGYGVPNVIAQKVFTPAENDSIALITMFDEMGGENWDIANNWRETPIAQWEEVELSEEENRVVSINLDAKGLVGQMPEIMNQLDQLQSFVLPNNEVTYIPNFSEVSSIQTLDVKQNRLDFTSIVANINVNGFDFKDQRRFGELIERELLDAGSSRTLTAPYLGAGVTYQWQFGPLIPGKSFNDDVEVIEGSGQVYTIQNISAVNQGTYRFIATHPSVEDFAIEGRNQNIFAKTDIAGTIRSDGSPISGGEVVIYRQTPEGPFAKEDSTTVGGNGSYALTDVVLGNFIVQVKPDREANPTSIQTYYISAESYDEADTLFLDSKMENIDIDLLFYTPAPTPETGATIAGTLESDFEEDTVDQGDLRVNGRRRVKKAGCAMRRFKAQGRPDQDGAETEIAYYLETDDEGYFSFEGVEPGRYLINIEFPGVPMNPESEVEFFIDPDKENQVFSVEALITESGIEIEQTEVLFTWKPYVKDVLMYPNPTDGILGMDYTVYRDINDLLIKVTNIEGRTLLIQEALHIRGRHHTVVNVTDLPSGIYFITLTDRAGTFSDQFKVSRR